MPTQNSEQRPTTPQHLQAVLDNYQNILGNFENAKSADPDARRKVLAAIERLRALAFERDKQCRRLNPQGPPGPDPADPVHRWPLTLCSPVFGWREDIGESLGTGTAAQIESLLKTPYHAGMRVRWRNTLADLHDETFRLIQILGPQPGPAAATPDPVSVAAIDDDAHLPPAKLATIFKVSKQRLQSSLNRWRPTAPDGCWIEVPNRKPREPQYLYRVGSIRPILDKLKSNSERTAK